MKHILATLVCAVALSLALPVLADEAADRDAYARKAQQEVDEWQHKLHEAGEDVEAKGKEAGEAVKDDLHDAWAKTREASRKLKAAGAEGWASAKKSYEDASHALARAWKEHRPDK
jgi:hypothetical protein